MYSKRYFFSRRLRGLAFWTSDRRGILLSINRITAGEKVQGCRRNVRKTSVNTVLYVSTSGSL